jgi:ABC-type sugar transport system ATPase subunit/ribose/xylose/arabinose/galactoside ABC-type transport system permease subunit
MADKKLLQTLRLTKSFFAIEAVKDVSFAVGEREILGLVGANGAGKSTLLKMIGGVHSPDRGVLLLDGAKISEFSPRFAQRAGIQSVYQELNLFPQMTVYENLFLGNQPRGRVGLIDWRTARIRAAEILESVALEISPDTLVANLSVAQQQLLEFTKGIRLKPKLLLLDEPTSTLSETEINWLFERIRFLVERGTTVIYVSHRLDEVVDLCSRILVMKDGMLVADLEQGTSKDDIVMHMVGRRISFKQKKGLQRTGETVFEARSLTSEGGFYDVDLKVSRGEILGIAGLVGSGRTELLRAIYGADDYDSGAFFVRGTKVETHSPTDAISKGVVLIPEDRKTQGLLLDESVQDNIALPTLDRRRIFGLVALKQETKDSTKVSKKIGLDPGRLPDPVCTMSGGNQQKTVIGKWLLTGADVILADEPTHGVDVGAKDEVHQLIRSLAEDGKSVILVSSEWEELLALSDRIVIMSEGRITGEMPAAQATEEKIMHLATIASARRERKAEHISKKTLVSRLINRYMLLGLLIILMLVAGIISPSFRRLDNAANIVRQAAALSVLTIGQMIVIISGNIDLSVGALVAVVSVLGAGTMSISPSMVFPAILVVLAIGFLVGLINGAMVVKVGVDSFIVTLGMMTVLQGAALIYTRKSVGPVPRSFRRLIDGSVLGVPNVLVFLIIVVLVFVIIMRYTSFGRAIYAVGENSLASYWAGLPVARTKILAFVVASLMGATGGLIFVGRMGAGDPLFGPGLELETIAAALIGGVSLKGGKGTILGVIGGVVLLAVLGNMLNLIGVQTWYKQIIHGLLLLIAIVIYQWSKGTGKQISRN